MFISSHHTPLADIKQASLISLFKSESSRIITELINQAALTDASVIIIGEINTGKRWTARIIHENGRHPGGPFHEISCLALPNIRIRRELFGHITYTEEGVLISNPVFQKANGGTLLIDAFTNLPKEMQLHLVSIMEQINNGKIINRKAEPLEVQLIITLDQSEYNSVKKEQYWEQLVERINPIFIHESPLRERREDIPVLTDLFLDRLVQKYKSEKPEISLKAHYHFIHYDWPGNLRQLHNAIEYALILSDSHLIEPAHLPKYLQQSDKTLFKNHNGFAAEHHSLVNAEVQLYMQALKKHRKLEEAAVNLGISTKQLESRLGLTPP